MSHEGSAEIVQGFNQRGIEPRVTDAWFLVSFGAGDIFAVITDSGRGWRSWRRHYAPKNALQLISDKKKGRAVL
jgi:hypothetical protein